METGATPTLPLESLYVKILADYSKFFEANKVLESHVEAINKTLNTIGTTAAYVTTSVFGLADAMKGIGSGDAAGLDRVFSGIAKLNKDQILNLRDAGKYINQLGTAFHTGPFAGKVVADSIITLDNFSKATSRLANAASKMGGLDYASLAPGLKELFAVMSDPKLNTSQMLGTSRAMLGIADAVRKFGFIKADAATIGIELAMTAVLSLKDAYKLVQEQMGLFSGMVHMVGVRSTSLAGRFTSITTHANTAATAVERLTIALGAMTAARQASAPGMPAAASAMAATSAAAVSGPTAAMRAWIKMAADPALNALNAATHQAKANSFIPGPTPTAGIPAIVTGSAAATARAMAPWVEGPYQLGALRAEQYRLARMREGIQAMAGSTVTRNWGLPMRLSERDIVKPPVIKLTAKDIVTPHLLAPAFPTALSKLPGVIGDVTGAANRGLSIIRGYGDGLFRMAGAGQQASRSMFYLRIAMVALTTYAIRAFAEFDDSLTRALARMGDYHQKSRSALEAASFGVSSGSITRSSDLNRALGVLTSSGMSAATAIRALSIAESYAVISGQDMFASTRQLVDVQQMLGLSSMDVEEHLTNMTRLSSTFYRVHQLLDVEMKQVAEAFSGRFVAQLRHAGMSFEQGIGLLSGFFAVGIRGVEAGERASLIIQSILAHSTTNLLRWQQLGIELWTGRGRQQSIPNIIEQLEKRLGHMTPVARQAELTLLGFERISARAILPLIGMSHVMREMEDEARNLNTTLAEMVANMIRKDFASQVKILRNNLYNLAVVIGQALAPVIAKINDGFQSMSRWFTALHPSIRQAIVYFLLLSTVAMPALRILASVALWLISPIVSLLAMAFGALTTFIGLVISAVGTIGAVVGAIGFVPLLVGLAGFLVSMIPVAMVAIPLVALLFGAILGLVKLLSTIDLAQLGGRIVGFFTGMGAFVSNFGENITQVWAWLGENWNALLGDMAAALSAFIINALHNLTILAVTIGIVMVDFFTGEWRNVGVDFIAIITVLFKAMSAIFVAACSYMAQAFYLLVIKYVQDNWLLMVIDMARIFFLLKDAIIDGIRIALEVGFEIFRAWTGAVITLVATIADLIRDAIHDAMLGISPAVAIRVAMGRFGAMPGLFTREVSNIVAAGTARALTTPAFTFLTPSWSQHAERQMPALNQLAAVLVAGTGRRLQELFANMPGMTANYSGLLEGIWNALTLGFNNLREPLEGFTSQFTSMPRRLRYMFELSHDPTGLLEDRLRRMFAPHVDAEDFDPMMGGKHGPGFQFQQISLARFTVGGAETGMMETQVFQRQLLQRMDALIQLARGNRREPLLRNDGP